MAGCRFAIEAAVKSWLSGRGRRDLKRLLNEAAVPAFARKRLPLLYCNGELVAVANLPQLSAGRCALNWCAPGC